MNRNIRFSGHTMGVPDKNIFEAIETFRTIGYDGIEVRVARDGQIDDTVLTPAGCDEIARFAREKGMAFSCLTPYYKNFVLPLEREETLAGLRRTVDIAAALSCPLVRVYGGQEAYELPGTWFADVWTRTVSGIREAARYAAGLGVRLCVETHIGSLTMSVRDTLRLIEDVGMDNVGILFDYAWVELTGVEQGAQAVRAAAGHLFHVHIKDWKLQNRCPVEKTSCLMGQGTVAWEEVLPALKETGYTGFVSDEYERYWYPEQLPVAEVGMKHNLAYVRSHIL